MQIKKKKYCIWFPVIIKKSLNADMKDKSGYSLFIAKFFISMQVTGDICGSGPGAGRRRIS
jgi:hypothetical protein